MAKSRCEKGGSRIENGEELRRYPQSSILAGKALFSLLPLADAGARMENRRLSRNAARQREAGLSMAKSRCEDGESRIENGEELRRYPQSSILYPRWKSSILASAFSERWCQDGRCENGGSRIENGEELRRYPQSSILHPPFSLPHYVRGGKTPCRAMMKRTVRIGIMLLWGRLPPAMEMALKLRLAF
jgi:hypothetical protein